MTKDELCREILQLPMDERLDLALAIWYGFETAIDLEHEGWTELGMSRLEEDWDNPEDAVYDDWKRLYY